MTIFQYHLRTIINKHKLKVTVFIDAKKITQNNKKTMTVCQTMKVNSLNLNTKVYFEISMSFVHLMIIKE